MLLHVAVSRVACIMNVNMILVQRIENHLYGPNPFCDILVLKFYTRGKLHYPSGQIYVNKTGIVSDVYTSYLLLLSEVSHQHYM